MSHQNKPDFIFDVETDHVLPAEKPHEKRFDFNDTKTISQILRAIGALIIVASASTFLFQHWTPGNDLQRYLLLLGATGILSLGGLFCGLRLQESKGARTLLGLTLAVTPINFAIMGALLFSQFSWDEAFAKLPNYATWVATSPAMAVLATIGGLIVLGPLCHFSFMTLGHKQAKLFSTMFVLSNLTLLLPTRQPNLAAVVFVLLSAALTCCEVRIFSRETMLNTFEGRLSRGILWVPALILVGRTCYIYTPSQLFISAIFTTLALINIAFLPQLTDRKTWQSALQVSGTVLAGLAWLNLADVLTHTWPIDLQWTIPFYILPLAALLVPISRCAIGNGGNYRRAAAMIAILCAAANLLIYPSLPTSFFCLLISIGVLIYGYLAEQKIPFFSGAAGAVLGLGYHIKTAFNYYSLTGWGSLIILGVAIIIAASLLERNNSRLREKLQHIRTRLYQWDN